MKQNLSLSNLFKTVSPGFKIEGDFQQYIPYLTIDWAAVEQSLSTEASENGVELGKFLSTIGKCITFTGPVADKQKAKSKLKQIFIILIKKNTSSSRSSSGITSISY